MTNSPVAATVITKQSSETMEVIQSFKQASPFQIPAQTRFEQLHVSGWRLGHFERSYLTMSFWLGPATVLHRYQSQSPESGHTTTDRGHGFALTVSNCRCLPLRLELALSWKIKWFKPQTTSSLHWSLALPPIIDLTSPILTFIVRGDVEGMKMEFSSRRATPCDTFMDGATLLHVCGLEL